MACWFSTHLLLPSAFCSEDQDLFFNANGSVYPVLYLGSLIHFPGIRRYTVSHSPVSVHLPIHRFISKMLDFAAYADLDLMDVIGRLIPTLAFTLADFPLRCLSFCAQVRQRLLQLSSLPHTFASSTITSISRFSFLFFLFFFFFFCLSFSFSFLKTSFLPFFSSLFLVLPYFPSYHIRL